MLDRIKTLLGQDWTATQDMIRYSLKSDIELLDATNSAILSTGGKQLRPILSLLVARACSGGSASEDSIRFAAASELLHNATLLHDDVADNSAERRGVPTVMSLLGGPASVLIGDFWLVRAMEIILSSETRGTRAIRIFAKTLSDLAEGEMLQLQKAESCDTTEEDYFRIIYNKTASLFEAAGVTAALSVDVPEDVVESVREYCVCLGIAFQIRDDMLDYSDGEGLGKPVGADLDERKITLPLLGALRSVGDDEASRIRSLVKDIPEHPEYKSEIRGLVFGNGGNEYATSRLVEFTGKAIKAIEKLPDSEEKEYLVKIARFTADRNK
ncbi:MAG: polyprenyl synthetase family protein [Bacteroidales bacterium]|nr:polyprenyl synthetase family protein [Bacteroidales bacterium]